MRRNFSFGRSDMYSAMTDFRLENKLFNKTAGLQTLRSRYEPVMH